ncbi:hypothetical protein Avbf_13593 [Armadillidium vulgare]|nr:hypothetical protein Avbf_13593 [Armadillidium vulgare]
MKMMVNSFKHTITICTEKNSPDHKHLSPKRGKEKNFIKLKREKGEKEEKFNSNISSKDGEKTENEEITEQEFPPTEGNDNEDTREVPTESSIDLKTEDPSITPEQPEQPEAEVKTKDNQIEENVTVNPATVEEDMLVTTNVEVISQDNENTEESKTDFESTSISTATEPMPESEEGVNSSNVDSVIISPEEDNTEDTTLRNDFPPTFEDSETLLKAPGEGVQKSGLERDKILGQREEHPRRYEEDSGKNEIPITFKITFDSEEGKKGERDNLRPPKLSPEDSFAEDYSLLEEIPDDLVGVEEILPPPHPICFTEGLVPDFYRCQVFYECVLENGKWEVYNWRCKRGSYYDPVKVACIRGYC